MTIACLGAGALGWTSCVDTEALESKLTDLEGKAEALEQRAAEINSNAISAYKMIKEGQLVMAVNAHLGPFKDRRLNIASAIIVPVGLWFYFRSLIFRGRLYNDLNKITDICDQLETNITNGDI